MRYVVQSISVLTAVLLSATASALDQSAPFGFSWGPVDKVPTPSLASREENVTLLMYRRDRLPSDELRDTEEIVLEICKKEGLQQIVWISGLLSAFRIVHQNFRGHVLVQAQSRRCSGEHRGECRLAHV